jgi:hypothetical protein
MFPARIASPADSSEKKRVESAPIPDEKMSDPIVGSLSSAASAFSTTWCASSWKRTRSRYSVVGLPRRV